VYDAHFESVKVAVLSVSLESPEYSFVTHSYKLDDAIFQTLSKGRVRRHHLNELNNLIFLFHVVAVVERWAIQIVRFVLKCGLFHGTKSVVVLSIL
jgi:hypothetical protein